MHESLASVIIEYMGYAELIAKYDSRPGSLFYLDPSYGDAPMIMAQTYILRGRFYGSERPLSNHPGSVCFVDKCRAGDPRVVSGFDIEAVDLSCRVSGKVTPAKELIISN